MKMLEKYREVWYNNFHVEMLDMFLLNLKTGVLKCRERFFGRF